MGRDSDAFLAENGVPIRSTDVYAIKELCRLIASGDEMEERLARDGRVARGTDRNPQALVVHPLVGQLDKNRASLWRAFERFGMTPVDSSRLPLRSKAKTPREKVLEGL